MEETIKNSSKLLVQYGCGWSSVDGWLNFDSSPTLRLERIPLIGRFVCKNARRFPHNVEFGDVVKGLPLNNDSVSYLYCSHVLEHLALDDFRVALKESFRILERGGVFRFVLPDFENAIAKYVANQDPNAVSEFLEGTILGQKSRRRGLLGFVAEWVGGSSHRWMWDYKGMKQELEMAGFSEVRRATFGDSSYLVFGSIEDEGRWIGELGVECKKPI
jgi:hypothetical protein